MFVKCVGEIEVCMGYSIVFSIIIFGCFGCMDLCSFEFYFLQKDVICVLYYDELVKVVFKFLYFWWIVDCGIIEGGVVSIDLLL